MQGPPFSRWADHVRALPRARRDVLVALLVAAVSFTPGLADKGTVLGWLTPLRAFDLIAVLLVLAHCAPLVVRGRAPALCLLLVSAAFFAYQCLGYRPTAASIALYLALYSAGAHQERFRRATAGAWVAVYVGVSIALVAAGSPFTIVESLEFLALPAGCWLMGTATRSRLRAQERRQELDLETAMREERERIARELHDVVTHHVTAMVMQADAAQYVPQEDRAAVVSGLEAIGGTGRRALADLRDLLGVLAPAHDAPAAPRAPTAGLLGDLVERTRLTGQPVDVVRDGEPRQVDGIVELAAYRVVQEALTNALKHAPGRRTVVRVSHAVPDEVTVEVTTAGGPEPVHGPPESGRGLAGLRRRVSLVGGELTARRDDDGGFVLRARLPTRSGAA